MSACVCGDNRIKRLLTLLYGSNGERERGEEVMARENNLNGGKRNLRNVLCRVAAKIRRNWFV